MRRILVLACVAGCADPTPERPDWFEGTTAAPPTVTGVRVVVPSDGLPPEAAPKNSNNNLDLVRHDGRLFLAFRTAHSHFASPETRLHVVSSEDEVTWRYETTLYEHTDLREPRFLSWDGKLFLYFALLGSDPQKFEPQGMKLTQYQGPGQWTAAESFYDEGFIPWRTKVVDGKPYMIAYEGGEGLYDLAGDPEPAQVRWLTTTDGRSWTPVVPGQPVVEKGGGTETDFVIMDDGAIVAVTRNEEGDSLGWGSRICRAEAKTPGYWDCVADPRKYDSPLLFRHGQGVWLIARRNVTESGNYDLFEREKSHKDQTLSYQIDYWQHPKRTALWQVDPYTLTVTFVVDFPSFGDTCFPGLVPLDEHRYLVYNYTSPLDGEDVSWLSGQLGLTQITRQVLSFQD